MQSPIRSLYAASLLALVAPLTLGAALAVAPGSVVKAELEVEDGNLVYSF